MQLHVDHLEVFRSEMVSLGKSDDVAQDLLTAVDLAVLVAELIGGVVVEGTRPYIFAQLGEEPFQ